MNSKNKSWCMYRIFVLLLICVVTIPNVVSADSYSGPYCFENPKEFENQSEYYHDSNDVRGTCRELEIHTVVSLDPALQKEYFLGTHEPIPYGCDYFCEKLTVYSELLSLTSSTTLKNKATTIEERPIQYALFDKAFFVPRLTQLFKKSGLSFSEATMPAISISVLQQSELDAIKEVDGKWQLANRDNVPFDYVKYDANAHDFNGKPTPYKIYTLDYLEYGKYIHAPKGVLAETQYADFEQAANILSEKDLQITQVAQGRGRTIPTVSIVNPLKSVTNYWMYTKKNGKLVLSWQKSEYGLDNGQVKTVTAEDKNVSTALLFSSNNSTVSAPVTKPQEDVATTTAPNTSGTASSSLQETSQPAKGFFARIWNAILSWFE